MKKNLLVVLLFVFALGCRKQVDNISLTGQTGNSPLNNIDNISFTKDNGLFISGSSGDKYTLIKPMQTLTLNGLKMITTGAILFMAQVGALILMESK